MNLKIYYSQSAPGFYIEGISHLPDDVKEISEERWQELLDGQSDGKIIDFSFSPPELVEHTKTIEDEIADAEAQKAELRVIADSKIAPLEDAVELGIATDEEKNSYDGWRKYRVQLNRIDTSTPSEIAWPTPPAA